MIEHSTKRKRGRPKFKYEEMLLRIKWIYSDIKTKRGLQNKVYEILALGVVSKMDDVEFLWNTKNKTMKCALLTEIGRFEIEEDIEIVSRRVCDLAAMEINKKTTTKEWVEIIRYMRSRGILF